MIVLKTLSDAERDGDRIYAVIRGTAENHGGRAASLTSPNPKAQTEVMIKAYQQANIDPRTVSYIEAHGTGTALGDPIEINGLKAAFAALYQKAGVTAPDQPSLRPRFRQNEYRPHRACRRHGWAFKNYFADAAQNACEKSAL